MFFESLRIYLRFYFDRAVSWAPDFNKTLWCPRSFSFTPGQLEPYAVRLTVNGLFSSDIKTIPCPINYLTYYQPYTEALLIQGSTNIFIHFSPTWFLEMSVVPFLCPHDDFRSMSIRELALDFGDFPSSASVVRTPKRLADFKVLTIA